MPEGMVVFAFNLLKASAVPDWGKKEDTKGGNEIFWSADGVEVELAAPGVGIYSTWLDGGYVSNIGTSMATPFVSGVAALVKSKNQSMTPQKIREAMAYGAIDLGDAGRDRMYGHGLVQTD